MKATILAQGDVVLMKVDELPTGLKKKNGATLALGEHTGHHHTFYDSDLAVADKSHNPVLEGLGSKNVELYESENRELFAKILEPVFLKHQEHKSFKVDVGLYKVGIVQEFDYEEMEARKVVD